MFHDHEFDPIHMTNWANIMLNRRIKTFKCLRKNLQFIVQDHQDHLVDRSYMHANSTKKQQGLPSSCPLPTFPWHHTASNHSVCFSGSSYHKTGTESNVPKLNWFFNFLANASLSSILIKFSVRFPSFEREVTGKLLRLDWASESRVWATDVTWKITL